MACMLAIAGVIVASLVPSSASSLPAGCARLEDVPAIGPACRVAHGYLVPVAGSWIFTHGGDPMPAEPLGVSRARPTSPACVSDPNHEFHGRVIYARPADGPNRYTQMLPVVRGMIRMSNGILREQAERFGRRMDYRFFCTRGEVSVAAVTLPTRLERTNFSTVVGDLIGAGFSSVLATYWVYFDGRPPGAPAGTGSGDLGSDEPDPENPNNHGPEWGITWGVPQATVMVHENGHNQGAVQVSAPHSSGAAHCIDGDDIMCYADGGPYASRFSNGYCVYLHYDCGNDDYFHPRPPAGSYLATHWNLGSAANRYFAGCAYRTGILRVPGGRDVDALVEDVELPLSPYAAVSHAVPRACRGGRFAVSGITDPVRNLNEDAGSVESLAGQLGVVARADFDVCWYRGARLLRCDAAVGSEVGTVPASATRARVLFRAGVGPAIYVLNIV